MESYRGNRETTEPWIHQMRKDYVLSPTISSIVKREISTKHSALISPLLLQKHGMFSGTSGSRMRLPKGNLTYHDPSKPRATWLSLNYQDPIPPATPNQGQQFSLPRTTPYKERNMPYNEHPVAVVSKLKTVSLPDWLTWLTWLHLPFFTISD